MKIVGIDLSKDKFDVNYINDKDKEINKAYKSNVNAITKFLDKVQDGYTLVAEYTGVYADLLVYLANQRNIPISLNSGFNIKHSLGMSKEKTDPKDAAKIREYGERFTDKLILTTFESEFMYELQDLYTLRHQLVKERQRLTNATISRESRPVQSIKVNQIKNNVVETLTVQIESLNEEIEEFIKKNPETQKNFEIVTSVTGIGPVIACDLIIKTGNFNRIDTARKCASFAGIAPFANESGKMVSKKRVSKFADKKLKSLLYMGSKAAVRHNKEYRLYYGRLMAEKKAHYLILNNVANKLMRTVYALVKSGTPFDRDYICLDPRERLPETA